MYLEKEVLHVLSQYLIIFFYSNLSLFPIHTHDFARRGGGGQRIQCVTKVTFEHANIHLKVHSSLVNTQSVCI